MGMVVDPTFTTYTICNRTILRSKVATIFSNEYKFIIKDVVSNIILNTIRTIVRIWARSSVSGRDRNPFAIKNLANIFKPCHHTIPSNSLRPC